MSEFILEHPLAARLQPFVVATAFNRRGVDYAPFDLNIPRANRIDPTRLGSEQFALCLQRLDGRTFGPEGMPMDRWVFYDCCYMPGLIFGFGVPVAQLSDHAREVLAVPDEYVGLVPYSMYIAIPMAPRGAWMGHNLASIGRMLPEEKLGGLGTLTKSIALKCFGVREFFGATQWSSTALYIHTKVGPLDLLTAYTPAHSEARTLTYGFAVDDESLLAAIGAPGIHAERPEADLWIDAGDTEAMIALQDRIEAGERFVIPGPPRRSGTSVSVPVSVAPTA